MAVEVNRQEIEDTDLESLAADVVAMAMKAGASDAEAVAREGDEFSVTVRMGEVEKLVESGSRALGLRVFVGQRSASTSTSDLTPDGIRQLVDGALALGAHYGGRSVQRTAGAGRVWRVRRRPAPLL